MKIYCQLTGCKTLVPTKGDIITEIGIMTALSQFADVYYSGTIFRPNEIDYGLCDYPEPVESHVTDRYDAYYVRANKSVFKAIPRRKPKLWNAAPFSSYCYQKASAVVTFTCAWKKDLLGPNIHTEIPKEHQGLARKVVVIHQVVGDSFTPKQDSARTRQIRKEIGGSFVIGYFGCSRKSRYPFGLERVWPDLISKYPHVRLLFATTENAKNLSFPHSDNVVRRSFEHHDMPYALSACDVIHIARYQFVGEICGCSKSIEAAACGVPILLGAHAARKELLGKDYPLFLPPIGGWSSGEEGIQRDAEAVWTMLQMIIEDEELRRRVGESLPEKAKWFSVEESGKRLQRLFRKLVKGKLCG